MTKQELINTLHLFDDPKHLDTQDNETVHLCKRCGRVLTDNISIQLGMGYTCYQKYIKEIHKNKTHILF